MAKNSRLSEVLALPFQFSDGKNDLDLDNDEISIHYEITLLCNVL
jgi:hypothetical protein